MPFSLYLWEAKALMDGARLRDIDQRRYLTEQAINIANIQNSKKPRKAAKAGFKTLDTAENKVVYKLTSARSDKPNVKMIQRLNKVFGGGS
ncbi:hypothetical protein [Lactiplantibacillus paraxiangfangensis]|uniref:hypothetical protein n=1 Tax=Lactiplantibacillus paraxiangfangensis TaxID=3076224 RepID=UPI0030C66D2C